MATTQHDVEVFLTEVRGLLALNLRFFVPRHVNRQGLANLGITEVDAWQIIEHLSVRNYCKGPENDRDGSEGLVWVFSDSLEGTDTYIKLKIEENSGIRLLKCLSFHPAQFPPSFPLRPRR